MSYRWTEDDVKRMGYSLALLDTVQPVAVKPHDAPRVKMPSVKSKAVDALVVQCRMLKLDAPVLEHRFWEGRRFAFDLAWPEKMLACEVEGIVYPTKDGDAFVKGRHASVTGFTRDCAKYAEALCLGWRVLRVVPAQVTSGEAVGWIQRALGGRDV